MHMHRSNEDPRSPPGQASGPDPAAGAAAAIARQAPCAHAPVHASGCTGFDDDVAHQQRRPQPWQQSARYR